MSDGYQETHDDAVREVEALRGACTHQRVISRPSGNAMGWTPCWVCTECSTEFVPRRQADLYTTECEELRALLREIMAAEVADEGCGGILTPRDVLDCDLLARIEKAVEVRP